MEREPRITRLDPSTAEGAVREVFDAFMRERGKVPNLFRVAAHHPQIMKATRAHMDAIMGPGEVDVLLKELLSVRVSQINDCEY